jgi:predicted nucleic acid-binding protein
MPNSWVCVDASLVVGLVIHPRRDRIRELWQGWQEERRRITAPRLLLYEVTNVIHQYARKSLLSAASADRLLELTLALPIELSDEPRRHPRALALARRLSLPATYDAHYLALAESLDAELWTNDRRLVNTVGERLPWVRLAV